MPCASYAWTCTSGQPHGRPLRSGRWRSAECTPGGVADGAMVAILKGNDLGWGGRVAVDCGVLATVHSRVSTMLSSPWAAEWASTLDAWDLAASLGSQ